VNDETIAAIATPEGRGGVGVIRVSGGNVASILVNILKVPSSQSDSTEVPVLQPRSATLATFVNANGDPIDQGIAIYFPAPHSYTGEDVLELQGHGGPVVLDLLLERLIELGARSARPGEFTERAFHNDKLDLSQAEAVCDLIDSGTQAAAAAAIRSLQGDFGRAVHALVEELTELRIYLEAALDFPEEEIDFLASTEMQQRASTLRANSARLMENIKQGQLLRDGFTVVLAGKPNAGKSSILNRLTGEDTAIVTDIEGTTRDIVRSDIQIDGLPVRLIDTAGLRDSDDPVEREGIKRAAQSMLQTDRILWIVDATQESTAELSADSQTQIIAASVSATLAQAFSLLDVAHEELPARVVSVDFVINKIDLTDDDAGMSAPQSNDTVVIDLVPALSAERATDVGITLEAAWSGKISAGTGAGFGQLREHLLRCAGFRHNDENVFIARRRHLEALHKARDSIELGFRQLEINASPELAAEDFRSAQNSLAEITGKFTSDDLLGRIFAGFCIGK